MAIWNKAKTKGPDAEAPRSASPRPVAAFAPSSSRSPDAGFLLPESIRLRGELVADSNVEIRGQVEGDVRADRHRVVVAETARVIAEVSACCVQVSGQVVGNISATEQIRIDATGCVLGDLCAPSIQLQDGARFTGGINRESAPAKVTCDLGREDLPESARSEIESAAKRARHRGLYDRRGASRPSED